MCLCICLFDGREQDSFFINQVYSRKSLNKYIHRSINKSICQSISELEPVDCQRYQAKAVALSIFNPTVWIPACDAYNKFVRLQRLEYRIEEASGAVKEINQTFCVNKHGKEYKNSRKDDGEIADCDEYIGMY